MADGRLLDYANQADNLAAFCQSLAVKFEVNDIETDQQVGNFYLAHFGQTPSDLRANHGAWKDKILVGLVSLDNVISKCYQQAQAWRDEYTQQQADDAAKQKAAEQAAAAAIATQNGGLP